MPGLAARTCANTILPAELVGEECRLRLLQAGVTPVITQGAGSPSAYQPIPNPSPFNGSSRSRAR
jgi:hypothetical protein